MTTQVTHKPPYIDNQNEEFFSTTQSIYNNPHILSVASGIDSSFDIVLNNDALYDIALYAIDVVDELKHLKQYLVK